MNDEKAYVSGPMTGIEEHNFPAFHEAAADLRAKGYEVVNPAERGDDGMVWAEYIARDVRIILNEGIDVLVMLLGWHTSPGSRIEASVAMCAGIRLVLYPDMTPLTLTLHSDMDVPEN